MNLCAPSLTKARIRGTIPRMARTTITQITDDLDGSKDATEVRFAYDGVEYVVDLSKKNRIALEKALQPYLDVATKVSRRSSRRLQPKNAPRDLQAIRAWAAAQGIKVSERGRIAQSVVDEYDAAH